MKKLNFKFILIAIILLCFASIHRQVYAHQTGASWEKVVGDFKVDVGYDPTAFVSGQSERFDFNAFDSSNNQVNFSDVWVRIYKGEETVFASGIHKPEFGLAGMIFEFPKSGEYTLDVRFENPDKNIVQASFPISVQDASDSANSKKAKNSYLYLLLAGVVGIILGVSAAGGLLKRK